MSVTGPAATGGASTPTTTSPAPTGDAGASTSMVAPGGGGSAPPGQEHAFTAQSGDTIWGQVRSQMDGAGMLRGKSEKEKNRLILEMVNGAKVLDENGREIKDKNLILKGKKYRIVFSRPLQRAPDSFRPPSNPAVPGIGGNMPSPTGGGAGPTRGPGGVGGMAPPMNTMRSDQVARAIAQEAATWDYDEALAARGRQMREALNNAPNFDRTESGVCTDMAFKAAKLFQEQGIDARVVGGKITDRQGNVVNHAWVEYMGEDGQWHRFDPTVAADTKNADNAITPEDSGLLAYHAWFEVMDDQNMNGNWTPSHG